MADREFDVVLFGATGFAGALTAQYLAKTKEGPTLRWAIAGRNAPKLDEVKRALVAVNPEAARVATVTVDLADAAALDALVSRARVVATTIGPYVRLGNPILHACVRSGTHYADLTGEPEFVANSAEKLHHAAEETGARIVHCCGFDSIPHDLGVLFTVKQLPPNVPIRVRGFVSSKGTFSGGTWHSALESFARVREAQQSVRKIATAGLPATTRSIHGARPSFGYVREISGWSAPLPTIDPQIVLRSAHLIDAYGPDFSYGHAVRAASPLTIVAGTGAVATLVGLAQIGPVRHALLNLRKPGEGPTAEQRARSRFRVTFLGDADGTHVRTHVSGGDPGYDETAKMLGESALCLALDGDRLPRRAGVLTPASAMGERLIERLQAAGIEFAVDEVSRA